MTNKTLIDAVRYRDLTLVEKLIQQDVDLEQRDHRGSTPLRIAAGSDQFVIAEKLIEAGADPFTMDSLYITAAGGVENSSLTPDSPDGAARVRLLEVFKEKGITFPVPSPQEMPQALEDGRWPKHATPPPLSPNH